MSALSDDSMTFFVMNTIQFNNTTFTMWLATWNSDLDQYALFHFKELFHYIIFAAMMFYILFVVLMVWFSKALPGMWAKTEAEICDFENNTAKDKQDQILLRYSTLKEERRLRRWRAKMSPLHWVRWWRAVNAVGYKIARESSRPVYESRQLIQLAFDVHVFEDERTDYPGFLIYCIRSVIIVAAHI